MDTKAVENREEARPVGVHHLQLWLLPLPGGGDQDQAEAPETERGGGKETGDKTRK